VNIKNEGGKIFCNFIKDISENIKNTKNELEDLLTELIKRKGSDFHLKTGEYPIFRIDGSLVKLTNYKKLTSEDTERMLLPIMEKRYIEELEKRNDTDFAYEIKNLSRFRVNIYKERKGLCGAFRAIPLKVVTADDLNLPHQIRNLCYLSKGLVLVTGPTGSGKSTTLCALIDLVNNVRKDHIITIEDPIEYVHENKNCVITQREIGVSAESFSRSLRAALREDPDVVLIGEMRDLETIQIALETAETGHLVFSTLHTTTAASTVDRIIDQFPPDQQEQIRVLLADELKAVITQTLCKKKGGGRIAAMEILIVTPAVSNLIREGKTYQINSVIQTQKQLGMITMNESLFNLVKNGIIEPMEAYIKAVDKKSMFDMLQQAGYKLSLEMVL
jgi:twitching motility protein PilT